MYRLYSLFFIIQIFCIYDAYKHNRGYQWYLLVLFLPILGPIIYLYIHFFNRRNIESLSDAFKGAINPNYSLEQRLKQRNLADTVHNRIMLSDEYARRGLYEEAKEGYESCLDGVYTDDPEIMIKLIPILYHLGDYRAVAQKGILLEADPNFKKSQACIFYAKALHAIGEFEQAAGIFESLDQRYCNYDQRIAYVEFLSLIGQGEIAEEKHTLLMDEVQQMDRKERILNKDAIKAIQQYNP